MGRRKIEIKPIKDDRNRSVTFLKRKSGLFKKAHELGVLCQVDVAVIILGKNNNKIFDFSSTPHLRDTLQKYLYYIDHNTGIAREHKGPADMKDKDKKGKDNDDDDDDDDDHTSEPRRTESPPTHSMIPNHLLHQNPNLQHVNQRTPAPSPPVQNRQMPHQPRGSSQPPLPRPDSRGQIRRPSSNLPQQQFTQPPPHPSMYGYQVSEQGFYPSQMPSNFTQAPHGLSTYTFRHDPMHMPALNQEQHQPMAPGSFQQPERGPSQPHRQPMPMPSPPLPQQHQQHQQQQQQQQQQQNHQQLNHQPQNHQPQNHPPPNHLPQGHLRQPQQDSQFQNHLQLHSTEEPQKSIFTPIEAGQSHFRAMIYDDSVRQEQRHFKNEGARSQSIDVTLEKAPPAPAPVFVPQRTQSTPAVLPMIPPAARANSQTKPKLQLEIPKDAEAGSTTADSSPKDTATTGPTPAQSTGATGNSVISLPPPSPSNNPPFSAGATGPPNPFARPPPPSNNNSYNGSRNEMETPLSALPSRFVDDYWLPSPSGWPLAESNMLPSPLPLTTPATTNGPSFRDEDIQDRKRKTPDGVADSANDSKRLKKMEIGA